ARRALIQGDSLARGNTHGDGHVAHRSRATTSSRERGDGPIARDGLADRPRERGAGVMRYGPNRHVPFKDRLRLRRMCDLGTRRETPRRRVYIAERASVLVGLDMQPVERTR